MPARSEDGVNLRGFVRDIPDFPTPGILFRDITPLLLDPRALDAAVSRLAKYARDLEVDYVVAAEARGFILGGALALRCTPASFRRASAGSCLMKR